MTRSRHTLAVVALWIVALALVIALLVVRFRAAHQPGQGLDFRWFFHPAGVAVAEGESPYTVKGYVYSPLVSLVVSTFARAEDPLRWWLVVVLSGAVVALVAGWLAMARHLSGWRGPAFVLVAAVTLLWSLPAMHELFLAQCQLLVLALLVVAGLAAQRGRAGGVGALLALTAVVKTWPGAALLWVLGSGRRQRLRTILAAVAVGLASVGVWAVWLGPGMLRDWRGSTMSLATQDEPAYSMFGLARALFSGPQAVIESPVLRWSLTIVGTVLLLGVLGVVLCRPGDPVISLFHVVGVVLLVMPVSHYAYVLLLVPLLWVHAARALDPRRPVPIGLAVGLVTWWVLVFRTAPDGLGHHLVAVLATAAVLAWSAVHEARAGAGLPSAAHRVDDGEPAERADPATSRPWRALRSG